MQVFFPDSFLIYTKIIEFRRTLCILYSIYDEKDKIDPRVSHCKLQSTNSEAKDVFEKCLKGQKFPKNYSPEYYTLASHLRPHTLPKVIDFPR